MIRLAKMVYTDFWSISNKLKLNRLKHERGGGERTVYPLDCGLKISLRFCDHIAQRLLLAHTYEPQVSAALSRMVRPGMTVFDIGANIGVHTLHLAQLVGPTGQVMAVEPNPIAAQELQRNTFMNSLDNVTVLNIALSNHDGESEFCFPEEGNEAWGSLLSNARFKIASRHMVKTAKLDTVVTQLNIPHVDFIKIDVEGAELYALEGAAALLTTPLHPTILYESNMNNCKPYSYTPEDLHQFLRNKGYRIETVDSEDFVALPVNTADGR